MSGGFFNYDQYKISQISEEIRHLIESNDDSSVDNYGDTRGRFYDEDVIEAFKQAMHALEIAYAYAQRVDWLVSGDDGPESFHKRLDADLTALNA